MAGENNDGGAEISQRAKKGDLLEYLTCVICQGLFRDA